MVPNALFGLSASRKNKFGVRFVTARLIAFAFAETARYADDSERSVRDSASSSYLASRKETNRQSSDIDSLALYCSEPWQPRGSKHIEFRFPDPERRPNRKWRAKK